MPELDSKQIQPSKTDSLEPQEVILERRKQAILTLIEEMTKGLPPMVGLMLTQYRSMVCQFVDRLTFEQTEELIDKVQHIIDDLRG